MFPAKTLLSTPLFNGLFSLFLNPIPNRKLKTVNYILYLSPNPKTLLLYIDILFVFMYLI